MHCSVYMPRSCRTCAPQMASLLQEAWTPIHTLDFNSACSSRCAMKIALLLILWHFMFWFWQHLEPRQNASLWMAWFSHPATFLCAQLRLSVATQLIHHGGFDVFFLARQASLTRSLASLRAVSRFSLVCASAQRWRTCRVEAQQRPIVD